MNVKSSTPLPAGTKAAQTKTIDAWSFSRWQLWAQCPFKAKCKFILKLPEPDNEWTARGNEVHTAGEHYVKGIEKKLSPSLVSFTPQFEELRRVKALAEDQWAFTRDWQETGYFARGENAAWLRLKMDAHYLRADNWVRVVDYKTGKIKPEDHTIQSDLYALAALTKFPHAQGVVSEFWYADHDEILRLTYTADEFNSLKAEWVKRIAPMFKDTKFPKRPSYLCRYCAYSKSKGGPCTY